MITDQQLEQMLRDEFNSFPRFNREWQGDGNTAHDAVWGSPVAAEIDTDDDPTPTASARPPRRRWVRPIAGVAAIAVLLAGAVIIAGTRKGATPTPTAVNTGADARIAALADPDRIGGGAPPRVLTANIDGRDVRTLPPPAEGGSLDDAVAFTPNGLTAAIIENRQKGDTSTFRLVLADMATGARRTVYTAPPNRGLDHPAFSFDGGFVAVAEHGASGPTDVLVLGSVIDAVPTTVAQMASVEEIVWSPTDFVLAVRGEDGTNCLLTIVSADATSKRTIPPAGRCLSNPAWSPDGKTIVTAGFTRNDNRNGGLVEIDPVTGSSQWLVQRNGPSYSTPAFSPDGRSIAYARDIGEHGPRTAGALFVARADGTNERQITDSATSWTDVAPTYSPDGLWIQFQRYNAIEDLDGPDTAVVPAAGGPVTTVLQRTIGATWIAATHPPPAAPGRGLRITVTNVAWTKISERNDSTSRQMFFKRTGAVIDLRCDQPVARLTVDGASPIDHPLDAAAICQAIRDNPTLLTNTDRADCSDLRYWEATVTIRGQLDGKETSLDLANCAFYPDAATTDAAQRWIKLLGMNIPGPDPPF